MSVKRVTFPNKPRKGQFFPHEKEEQFSTELKRQVKRKKKGGGVRGRAQETLEGLKLKSGKFMQEFQ